MTDAVTVVAAARWGWQLLAKVPLLSRWVLRRVFPVGECGARFKVDMPGNHARFELLSVRPSPALTGLEVQTYNLLPFPVSFSTSRLTANIESTGLFDAVLNTSALMPAAGFGRITLPEIGLTDQQGNWVRRLERACVRVQLNLHWRCASRIHDWERQGTYEFLVQINKDANGPRT